RGIKRFAQAKMGLALLAEGGIGAGRFLLRMAALGTGNRNPVLERAQKFLACVGGLAGSAGRGWTGAVGAVRFGFTSVWPTKVTPSSITSRAARMSPNISLLDLMSIF